MARFCAFLHVFGRRQAHICADLRKHVQRAPLCNTLFGCTPVCVSLSQEGGLQRSPISSRIPGFSLEKRREFRQYEFLANQDPLKPLSAWVQVLSTPMSRLSSSAKWWLSLRMIWGFGGPGSPDLMTELYPPQDTA